MTAPPYFIPNTIYCGDCLEVLNDFPDDSVSLIYADPPFFSNKHYEIIWGDGYEIRAFEDRWKGGIEHYTAWMEPRLKECYRVLHPKGTMYLHCDWRADAHLRILMDRIFAERNMRNEIIWCFRGAGYPKMDFGRRHNMIFRYSKTDDYIFNLDAVRDEYAEATKERFKHYIGNVRNGMDFGVQKLNPKGRQPDDWWQIQPIAPSARDRLGYPTQKPEPLLEKIIRASSNPNDIVLDPFCGCGTAIAVALKEKRQWIGVDVSPTACHLMQRRMLKLGASPRLMGMPLNTPELRKLPHFEFQNWIVKRLLGRVSARKTGDMGIDGYSFEGYPIQVKQSDDVGRIVIDNFETAMRRVGAKRGIVVAFSFGKGAYEEVARAKNNDGLEIQVTTVLELIKADRTTLASALAEQQTLKVRTSTQTKLNGSVSTYT